MKLDLNNFLQEIKLWKNIVKYKDDTIENLKKIIKESKTSIEKLECSNACLLQEISYFNNTISGLYQSLSRLAELESENKQLVEEKLKLEERLGEQEKKFQSETSDLKEKIEKLKVIHKEEIENKLSETDAKVSSKLQKLCETLREKENCILQLEDEISKLKNERNQESLKIKIECDEKISKLKNKLSKRKGLQYHFDNKSTDILRQKYIEKEKHAKEETIKLKKEIEKLLQEVNSLKSKSSIFSEKNSTSPVFLNTSNKEDRTSLAESFNPEKKLKLTENSSSLVVRTTTNPFIKQTNIVQHFRKKLFNLDMNYFDK